MQHKKTPEHDFAKCSDPPSSLGMNIGPDLESAAQSPAKLEPPTPHLVIPANAGIQGGYESAGSAKAECIGNGNSQLKALDSRVRGNDEQGRLVIPANLPQPAPSLLKMPKKGVYAITPSNISGATLINAARAALSGGAVMLQYRAKPANFEDALALKNLCDEYRAPLIINDNFEIAKALGCGVHLGETDAGVAQARKELGADAIIGASCYDSVVLAQRALENGASYVAFGSFFVSSTKSVPRRADIALLRKAAVLNAPCVAIGGIELGNAAPLIAAGVDFIAVVNGIFGQPDIQAASRALSQLFND